MFTFLRPVKSLRLASLFAIFLDCIIFRNNDTCCCLGIGLAFEGGGQNPEKQGLPRSLPSDTTGFGLPNRLGSDPLQLCAMLPFLYWDTSILLIMPQSSLMKSNYFTIPCHWTVLAGQVSEYQPCDYLRMKHLIVRTCPNALSRFIGYWETHLSRGWKTAVMILNKEKETNVRQRFDLISLLRSQL